MSKSVYYSDQWYALRPAETADKPLTIEQVAWWLEHDAKLNDPFIHKYIKNWRCSAQYIYNFIDLKYGLGLNHVFEDEKESKEAEERECKG